MNILFVCTGNTCRSPMAEAVAKDILKIDSIKSAGIFAMNGESASDNIYIALENRGINDFYHSARKLTPELIKWADLILCMNESHRESIFYIYENAKNVELLCEDSVPDPFGGDLALYEKTLEKIEDCIRRRFL